MAREYFCAYHSMLDAMRRLSDVECGRLFRALLAYSAGKEAEQFINLEGREGVLFDVFTQQIDRDNGRYEEICEKNRQNRKKSLTTDNGRQRSSTVVNDGQRSSTKRDQIDQDKDKEKEKEEDKDKDKDKEMDVGRARKAATPPAAPSPDLGPTIFQIPLNDGSMFDIHQAGIDRLQELYPAVNVPQEFRNIIGWTTANPTKRKTSNGVKWFIDSWMRRVQNQGGQYHQAPMRQAPMPAPKRDQSYTNQRDYTNVTANQDHMAALLAEAEADWRARS